MKICLVNSYYPPWIGGAETYVSNVARLLARRGHEVTVYCAHNPLSVGETIEEGVRVRRMSAPLRFYGTPIALIPPSIFVEDYDIIHCNFPGPYLAAAFSFLSAIRRIPAVLTWHNDLPAVTPSARLVVSLHNLLLPLYLNQYRKIIATTNVYAKKSPVLRKNADKVVVISNGVDSKLFTPSVNGEAVRTLHGLSGKKVILFVGALTRWHKYKGLSNLIQAFGLVNREESNTHLLIVGGGDLISDGRKLVNQLGLTGRVTFAGSVPQETLPEYYSACDFFVLPSRDDSEGYGLALLEAMSAGKPTIGTKVGGIIDVVRDGVTGLLVLPDQPELLAGAMAALINDEDLCNRMGRAGRAFAEKNEWKNTVKVLESLYLQVRRE